MKRTYNNQFAKAAEHYELEAVGIIKRDFPFITVIHNKSNSKENYEKHTDITLIINDNKITIDVKGKSESDFIKHDRWLCVKYSVLPDTKTWLYVGAEYIGFFTPTELLLVKRECLCDYANRNNQIWITSKYGDHDIMCPISVSKIKSIINQNNGYILKRQHE